MEHRYGKRFPTDIKTLIFKNGIPVAIGRIINFSRDGVFVRTEFDLIDLNQSLEIELISRGSSRSPAYDGECRKCKTFVMHKASDGMGLFLRDDCAETQNNFAAFVADELSHAQSAADPFAIAALQVSFSNSDFPR